MCPSDSQHLQATTSELQTIVSKAIDISQLRYSQQNLMYENLTYGDSSFAWYDRYYDACLNGRFYWNKVDAVLVPLLLSSQHPLDMAHAH